MVPVNFEEIMDALYKIRREKKLNEDNRLILDMYIDSLRDDDTLLEDAWDFVNGLLFPGFKAPDNIQIWPA